MKLTFLGTGTSTGVPSIGCECETCVSDDPRDKRLRVSIIIEQAGRTVLVDTSADFRQQALRFGLKQLDAVLITHCHADHVTGAWLMQQATGCRIGISQRYGAAVQGADLRFDHGDRVYLPAISHARSGALGTQTACA